MTVAVSVENLSKRYVIDHEAQTNGYRTLRESLVGIAKLPWRRGTHHCMREEFLALKNVSFEIRVGEVVGIIGRNGAGKSTLLKVLSRITAPTTGRATINGRVGSLLEVGTGFHPELTGRENIFMNGSILGMSRFEIKKRFDEIVDFSGVGRFLDTPTKRYSSGMQVRLAFAVAAHLEPEVIVVDEVLAVGDLEFQRKCLGKMSEVANSGRTVLFVSHNMAAVEALCHKGILMDGGVIADAGDIHDVVQKYSQNSVGVEGGGHYSFEDVDGSRRHQRVFQYATLINSSGITTNVFPFGESVLVRLGIQLPARVSNPTVGIGFDDSLGQRILSIMSPKNQRAIQCASSNCTIECLIPALPLAPGDYWLKIALAADGEEVDVLEQALCLRITNADTFRDGRGFTRGKCIAKSEWSVADDCRYEHRFQKVGVTV